MRRRLLASVTAVALLYGTSRPAYALFGVGDIVFDPASYGELVTQAKSGLEELKWLGDLYGDAEKNIQILTNVYNLFAHVTNVTQIAQVLNSQFLKSPMLTDVLQIEQAFNGLGLHTTLVGKITAILARARYYHPSDNDFTGFHLNKATTATAGQTSSAQDAYSAATQRVDGFTQLLAGITADPKSVLDLTARATIETGTAVAQGNQLAAARLMQEAARDTLEQQKDQAYRYSADNLRAQAQAAADAANNGAVNLITQ